MGPNVKHTYHFKALSWDTMALPVGLLKLSSAQKQKQSKQNQSKQNQSKQNQSKQKQSKQNQSKQNQSKQKQTEGQPNNNQNNNQNINIKNTIKTPNKANDQPTHIQNWKYNFHYLFDSPGTLRMGHGY